jgi:hypothetical protein
MGVDSKKSHIILNLRQQIKPSSVPKKSQRSSQNQSSSNRETNRDLNQSCKEEFRIEETLGLNTRGQCLVANPVQDSLTHD